MKQCPRCNQVKPRSAFHKRSRAKDGLALWCKTCVAEYGRARYQANPDAAVERARLWQQANRERKAVISRRWAARNRESASEAVRRWNAANPDRARKIKRDAQQRRRALQEGAHREEWTTTDILERDGWECQVPDCCCPDGRAIDPSAEYRWRGTVDHVIPLSRGGDDVPANLRAAHQTCNSAKRAWLDHEIEAMTTHVARLPDSMSGHASLAGTFVNPEGERWPAEAMRRALWAMSTGLGFCSVEARPRLPLSTALKVQPAWVLGGEI